MSYEYPYSVLAEQTPLRHGAGVFTTVERDHYKFHWKVTVRKADGGLVEQDAGAVNWDRFRSEKVAKRRARRAAKRMVKRWS
jgi:hypothetical protein